MYRSSGGSEIDIVQERTKDPIVQGEARRSYRTQTKLEIVSYMGFGVREREKK